MSGFLRDPLGDIQLIADNLRDRYKSGFPILKEIVQNADDAKASSLCIGWHQGLAEAEHPLLRDPAMFFINDAPLSNDDARGIRSIGLGTKADNKNAVGKFGLGMKSLFHLGEVYFFIGSDWQEATGEYSRADVLNPWSDGRPEWEDFSDNDKLLIQKELNGVAPGFDSASYTFIVWVPLRSDSIAVSRNENYHYIINSKDYGYEVPTFFSAADLPVRLGKLLPMLKQLKSITGYKVTGQESTQIFSLKLNEDTQRIAFPNLVGESNWSGIVQIESFSQTNAQPLSFYGAEVLLESSGFQKLKENNYWPTSYARDRTGAEKQIQDKARPHAATVVLAQQTQGQAKLTLQWAVFLPLGEQDTGQSRQVFEIDIEGNVSFDLFMHGYFFIDAGRVGIHGRQHLGKSEHLELVSEETTAQEWNRLLANEGTLPRILSSLSLIASNQPLKEEQILALSKGLCRYFEIDENRRYLKYATADNQWVYQVAPGQSAWALISTQQATRPLPSVPASSNGSEIWEAIPGLLSDSADWIFIEQDKPNIKSNRSAIWRSEEIAFLLQSIPSSTFASKKLLNYLNKFLANASVKISFEENYQSALINLARKSLKEIPLLELSRNQSAVKMFINLIKSTYRWTFKLDKEDQDAWDVIAKVETEHFVIIPDFLEPTDVASSGVLDFDVVDKLLKNIAQSSLDVNRLEKFILYILSAVSSDVKNEIIRKNDNIPLFRAFYPNNPKAFLESRRNLSELLQNRRLFRRGEMGSFNLGKALQQTLLNKDVVFINEETNRVLFESRANPCDTKFILHLINKRPELSEAENRVELISKLDIEKIDNNEDILSVRYLLHASESDNSLSVRLWSGGLGDSVWSDILRESQSAGDNWTVIPYEISHTLRLSAKEKIGLKEINYRDVLEELSEDIQYIDFSKFVDSQAKAEEILQHIDEKSVWLGLQLHRTKKGEFTSINESCALESDYILPENLSENIIWIEPAKTAAVQKQQRDYLHKIDAQKAIELALSQTQPSDFESFILDSLALSSADLSSIQDQLKTTAWLSIGGKPVSPNQIIAAQIDTWPQSYALSKKTDQLYFAEELNFKNHPNYTYLKDLFLNDSSEIVKAVIDSAAKLNDYMVGASNINTVALKQAIKFSHIFKGFIGWELIIECCTNYEVDDFNIGFLNNLTKEISSTELVVKSYKQLIEEKLTLDAVLDLRLLLLSQICNTDMESARETLKTIKLRAQNDSYKLANQLCYDVVGADSCSLLHDSDWQIVKRVLRVDGKSQQISSTTASADSSNYEHTAEELNKYFSSWEPHVPNKLAIAANLALMSGTSGVRNECGPYLGMHSLEKLIGDIGKDWQIRTSTRDNPVSFPGLSLSEAVDKMQFSVSCFDGEKAVVQSLFSEKIEVDLESDYRTVFIWESYSFASTTELGLLLRKLPVAELSEERLLDILKNSAELLLEKVYEQRLRLDHIWEGFSGAEQLDITAAKIATLDGIIYQLKELRLDDKGISTLIKEYDNNIMHAAEKDGIFGSAEKTEVIDKICRAVEGREDLQQEILKAIRVKISQAQYHPRSIPFELFQNADDAVVELGRLGVSQDEMDARSLFRVRSSDTKLNFMNWGREVNQYRVTSSSIDGSDFGFKTDLQKMIARNQSDKDTKTTGKFGLGFKSCLLVTDTPYIVSGRLAVQVVGGLLPRLPNKHEELFNEAQNQVINTPKQGKLRPSIISLPLKKDINSTHVLSYFSQHAGLMTVFAKQIRTIDINGDYFRWHPTDSKIIKNLSFGTVRIATKKRTREVKVANIKTSSGDFVFRLSPNGFISLGSNVPKLWHLAPLLGESRLDFAINAAFDVDIGRNQLAISSDKNRMLFCNLGRELSSFLKQLFKACEDNWADVQRDFGFDETTNIADLWISVWSIIQNGIYRSQDTGEEAEVDSHGDLIRHMFSAEAGIMKFYHEHKAFPVGLSGAKPQLVTVTNVTHRASELLTNMSAHMVKLPLLDEHLKKESLVSYSTGRSLLDLDVEIPTLELESLLDSSLDDNYLSPTKAGHLYSVFDNKFYELISQQKTTQEQVEKFKNKLSEITVLTKSGTRRAIKEALLQHSDKGHDDEKLVTGFAPENVIASGQYNKKAISFIAKCRRETVPYNSDKLFNWINSKESAESIDKQKAICSYIVAGQYGQELAEKSKAIRSPNWLLEINVQHLKNWGWDTLKIDHFRNVKMVTKSQQQQRISIQLKTEGATSLSHTDALNRVYEWWVEKGEQLLRNYDKELYPGGNFDWHSIKQDNRPELYKKAWLKLLFLGSCQTIGRSKDVQHRAALEFFENKGWWDVFVNSEDSAAWFNVMDQYLSNAIADDKYRTWLQILPLYRFSSYLDDYIDLFCTAEFQLPDIKSLIQPGSSASLSGSGFAPPELKSTLGIGTNFILRELYRHEVYSDKSIERHCFVASRGVRELLTTKLASQLTFDSVSAENSEVIYDFLCDNLGEEKATFNGAFDIPLRILSKVENSELLTNILQIGTWR